MKKSTFFSFRQNNSGGSLVVNSKVCKNLYIEAEDYAQARGKALELGVYFNGVDEGDDCECCGDRWSDYEDKLEFPYRYSHMSLEEAEKSGIQYAPTTWKRYGTEEPDEDKYDLIFKNIEEYAQYISDKFSWGKEKSPDARIYYADGSVKEIIYKGGQQ